MFKFFYKKQIILFFLVSVIFLNILIFISVKEPFRLKEFNYKNENGKANLSEQIIKIRFNNPLKSDNISELKKELYIEPYFEFSLNIIDKDLFILAEESLYADTKYSITMKKSLTDIYGNKLGKNLTKTFFSNTNKFYFIENKSNTLKLYDIHNKTEKSIYKSQNTIKLYSIGKEKALIVTEEKNGESSLVELDLQTGKSLVISQNQYLIENVSYSSKTNKFYLLLQTSIYEQKLKMYLPDSTRDVFTFNPKEKSLEKFDLNQNINFIESMYIEEKGRTMILKFGEKTTFSLVDLLNKENIVPLKRYVSYGDSTYSGDEIVFSNYSIDTSLPIIESVDSNKIEKTISDKNKYSIDPQISNKKDYIFSEQYLELENSKGIFKVVELNSDLKTNFEIISAESLELPKLSIDERYLSVEAYTPESTKGYDNIRIVDGQYRPANTKIKIYDRKEKKLLEIPDIAGHSVFWAF